jgi:hypothetical protein
VHAFQKTHAELADDGVIGPKTEASRVPSHRLRGI